MSDFVDNTRERLRDLEFRMPPRVSRPLLGAWGIPSPYRAEDHALRCLFIHVPKSGGTSVTKAVYGSKARHIPLARYAGFDADAVRTYFKFAFVRNPWSRFHSAYAYLVRRVNADPHAPDHRWATRHLSDAPDFETFVRKLGSRRAFRDAVRRYIHFRDQADWLVVPGQPDIQIDFVGRFERLHQDFATVANRLGLPATLPQERIGGGHDYRSAYSPWAREFVGDLYARDIRLFGYGFDS